MSEANRTLEDGQRILIDGAYPLVHNVHGTVNDWSVDTIDEHRSALDERTRHEFYSRIEGEWTLDVEKTLERSIESPIGDVTVPITVTIGPQGKFEISARGISVGDGVMQLAVDVTGTIDAETIIHNDRLMFEMKITNVDASNCSLTLAGISLPGLEEMIEGFLKFFHRPQRIEIKRVDADIEEMHIVADAAPAADEMTQVLTRRKPWRMHILNRPEFVSQQARHLCWAAAIASISRTLKLANREKSIVTPPPTDDPFPEFTVKGVIETVRKIGQMKPKKNWFHGDNFEPGKAAAQAPHGDTDRLLLEHDESDWSKICEMFWLPPIQVYYATEGKHAVAGAIGLTMDDIKSQIDRDRYGLMAFADPVWEDANETKPTWHVVVIFGYDMDGPPKLLVLDPNARRWVAKQINPKIKYFITWKSADTWDEATQKWLEGNRKNF